MDNVTDAHLVEALRDTLDYEDDDDVASLVELTVLRRLSLNRCNLIRRIGCGIFHRLRLNNVDRVCIIIIATSDGLITRNWDGFLRRRICQVNWIRSIMRNLRISSIGRLSTSVIRTGRTIVRKLFSMTPLALV